MIIWLAKDISEDEVASFQSGAGVPLEMYFNDAGDWFYVTTAKPGNLHIFDIHSLKRRMDNVSGKYRSVARVLHYVAFAWHVRPDGLLNLRNQITGLNVCCLALKIAHL